MRDLQRIYASSEIEQLQVHKAAGAQVGAHHRLRHAAPSDTG
jgi:hypothetical protein